MIVTRILIGCVYQAQRAALPPYHEQTPVTLQTFTAWKEKKRQEKRDAAEAKRKAEAKKTGTRGLNALTGRDLYALDLTLFVDDEGALDFDDEVDIAEGLNGAAEDSAGVEVYKEWGTGQASDAAPAQPPEPPSSAGTAALYLDECALPDC